MLFLKTKNDVNENSFNGDLAALEQHMRAERVGGKQTGIKG